MSDQIVQRKVRELLLIFERVVEVRHIGSVVLTMVNLHGSSVDMWLKRV
jgi:hypothetical protein